MHEKIFNILSRDGSARTGQLKLAHGMVQTPAFMPVGTVGTVKGMRSDDVLATGSDILLGNVYHLMLRPGADRIKQLGGLHTFMNWSSPILTDSGGFQVMSLSKIRNIDESGVEFRAHTDGCRYYLTPKESIDIQYKLGSDVTMVLDECISYPMKKENVAKSMRRSMKWAGLGREQFKERSGYAIFGIVQGGIFHDLREESAGELINIGFDGYAIGGLAVGEGQGLMLSVLDKLIGKLPANQPRYLMGVGTPSDIIKAVCRGVDMFDCVLPTRSGRTGRAYTTQAVVNLRNARHASDPRPLDKYCTCETCQNYSRAYLHHLFRCGEMLGPMLLTKHNLTFYQELMKGLRGAISANNLYSFCKTFISHSEIGDVAEL